ncbi:hypothetical protein UlMin_004052, partial [Ulmus minor]
EKGDTQEEVHKRNCCEELEEHEMRHFSSKDMSYDDDRDCRKGNHLLLEEILKIPLYADAEDFDVESKVMTR